jgi:hypothetical protein
MTHSGGTHSGGTHGPRHDDALKAEVRSEVQANRATRTEEWREPEPPGDDQPDATVAPVGRPSPDRGPTADQIQLRSDIARYLDRHTFPADRDELLEVVARQNAPDEVADLVSALPGRTAFASVAEVAGALGLPAETREQP